MWSLTGSRVGDTQDQAPEGGRCRHESTGEGWTVCGETPKRLRDGKELGPDLEERSKEDVIQGDRHWLETVLRTQGRQSSKTKPSHRKRPMG